MKVSRIGFCVGLSITLGLGGVSVHRVRTAGFYLEVSAGAS